ncbi:MAG: hypothetical protein V4819_01455 [Verrucomicrobiota bacterium]
MKSPLQTAFEKMTNEELKALFEFVADRSKGAAARLCVIEGQLEFEQRQRGITAKPKGINAISHPEESLADLVLRIRSDEAARVQLAKGTKSAMVNLDDQQFMQTARAHFGVNQFFGDEAMSAAKNLDEQFFKSAGAAIRTIKMRKRNPLTVSGESRMLLHIQAALTILHQGDERGDLPQRKITKQQLEADVSKRLGDKAFSDRDSWQAFFKRPEIKPFVTQARGK